jgi:hypothetical protein
MQGKQGTVYGHLTLLVADIGICWRIAHPSRSKPKSEVFQTANIAKIVVETVQADHVKETDPLH